MGLLRSTPVLTWLQIQKIKAKIKENGIKQFIKVYEKASSNFSHEFIWGDEIEFICCCVDDNKVVKDAVTVEESVKTLSKQGSLISGKQGETKSDENRSAVNDKHENSIINDIIKKVYKDGEELEEEKAKKDNMDVNRVAYYEAKESVEKTVHEQNADVHSISEIAALERIRQQKEGKLKDLKLKMEKEIKNIENEIKTINEKIKGNNEYKEGEVKTHYVRGTHKPPGTLLKPLTPINKTSNPINIIPSEQLEHKNIVLYNNSEDIITTFEHLKCSTTVEFARYMIETIPKHPHNSTFTDLLSIEKCMITRINDINQYMKLFNTQAFPLFMTHFPKIGKYKTFSGDVSYNTTMSKHFPDEGVTRHKRFFSFIKNIRNRRGKVIEGYIMQMDENIGKHNLDVILKKSKAEDVKQNKNNFDTTLCTENPFETVYKENPPHLDPNYILIDSMGQGMGNCCLQLTLQASTISEARVLYDMLGALCPLFLRLTRATPIAQGKLLATETRWDMVKFSVDCRTDKERASSYETSGGYYTHLEKNRFKIDDDSSSENEENKKINTINNVTETDNFYAKQDDNTSDVSTDLNKVSEDVVDNKTKNKNTKKEKSTLDSDKARDVKNKCTCNVKQNNDLINDSKSTITKTTSSTTISSNIISGKYYSNKNSKYPFIQKSRFSSIDMYISTDDKNLDYYNDIDFLIKKDSYELLLKKGVDEKLSRHVASLFVRDPILAYKNEENVKAVKEMERKLRKDEIKKAKQNDEKEKYKDGKTETGCDREKEKRYEANFAANIKMASTKFDTLNNPGINNDDLYAEIIKAEGGKDIYEKATRNTFIPYNEKNKEEVLADVTKNYIFFDTDDFENIQSSNWRSMRFKLPTMNGKDTEKGWKVEVRPMELQPTAFENASWCIFIVLLARTIIAYELNFYIPISLVDENFRRANLLFNSYKDYKGKVPQDKALFYYRVNIFESTKAVIREGTIKEIFMGKESYEGILNVVCRFVREHENALCDTSSKKFGNCVKELFRYIDYVRGRIDNDLMSVSDFIRKFIINHKEYEGGNDVSERMINDLVMRMVKVTEKNSDDYLRNE